MALTIGFDATPAVRQRAGIGRYARSLLAALAGRDDDFRYHLYSLAGGEVNGHLPAMDERFRHRTLPLTDRLMNIVWHRARLPLPVQMLAGSFDLFHSPDFTLPPVMGKPTVLTIHDLAFLTVPECAYPTLRAYLARVVPRSAHRASIVIAVSEQTKQDVIEHFGMPEDRVRKILAGVGPEFRPLDERLAREKVLEMGVSDAFILSVGTIEPRKNYIRLFEAYANLRSEGLTQKLVIAGRPGWLYQPILDRVQELRLGDHIEFVAPDDEQLIALYNAADVFVFPSLFEGFGIPPLEALACGAPVTCSRTSSLPEVVGDAALLFDPHDVGSIAGSITRLLEDSNLRAVLRERGLRRAAELTWERAAAETARVYEEVAGA